MSPTPIEAPIKAVILDVDGILLTTGGAGAVAWDKAFQEVFGKSVDIASYLVKPGDTLNRIAMETRPDGVSVDQMLSALFQGNRGAFAADDVNRLQAGKILRIPDAEGVRQLAPGGRQVVAQSSDFGRYRQRLAEQAAASAPKEAPARQSASGRIGARIEDKAQALPAGADQLKVSKGADAASADFSRLCSEARTHGFATVCVPSAWVRFCVERLAELGVTT